MPNSSTLYCICIQLFPRPRLLEAYQPFWGGEGDFPTQHLRVFFPFLWGLSLDVSMEVRNRIFELFSEMYNSKGITPAITALYGPFTWNRNNIPLPSFLLKALLYLETLKISGHMIKKSSGAPPPRRPGAAVRTSPAPRRPHSNSLRSRAAAASLDPPARPTQGEGRPAPAAPLLRPRVPCPSVRPSVLLPPRPPPGSFVRRSRPAGPTSRPFLSPPPPDSAQGNGLRAEVLETGSEAREPHERAAARAGVRVRL